MKVMVDMNLCQSHGECVTLAPGVALTLFDTFARRPGMTDATEDGLTFCRRRSPAATGSPSPTPSTTS
jgi:hypothetical protein